MEHIKASDFRVQEDNSSDLDAVKARYGVPRQLHACHTAIVDGYVVEGHVPAADIRRLLAERPDVVGIAVPEMPIGSPGMEAPDGRTEPYDVIAFKADGTTEVFARH